MIRNKPQKNKKSGLPNGISVTWRLYPPGNPRRPYLEYQVLYKGKNGKLKIKHFYIGKNPGPSERRVALKKAVKFREEYERESSS